MHYQQYASRRFSQGSGISGPCSFHQIVSSMAVFTTTLRHQATLLNALCIRHRTSQLGCACIPDWDVIASGHTDRATNVAAAHLR